MRSIDELCPETSDTQGNASEVVPNEEFAKVLAKELGKALSTTPEEPTEPEEQEEPTEPEAPEAPEAPEEPEEQ